MSVIAQISDIHCRNASRIDEYNLIFDRLYEKLYESKPDLIVLAGDIFHNKLVTSPSSTDMVFDLFDRLSSIAPLHCIHGNHDINIQNKDRLDCLTPIVKRLKKKNIFLYKKSGLYQVTDTNIIFGVFSILDKKHWPVHINKKPNYTYIALFHGPISKAVTDIEWTIESKFNMNLFDSFQFLMAGDIHLHQKLRDNGSAAYAGSLIQQDFGEDTNKGFLLWDIKDANNYSSKFISIHNEYAFITLEFKSYLEFCNSFEDIFPDDGVYTKNTKFRIFIDQACTNSEKRDIKLKLQMLYKTEATPVVIDGSKEEEQKILSALTNRVMDFSDPINLNKIIRQYLKLNEIPIKQIDSVVELHDHLYHFIDIPKRDTNTIWKLEDIVFSNLFCYGDSNRVLFKNMKGIIGLFAKNGSGKSSLLDAILYSVFFNTTKKINSLDIINAKRNKAFVRCLIELDGEHYIIQRNIERIQKKKGQIPKNDMTFVRVKNYDNQNILIDGIPDSDSESDTINYNLVDVYNEEDRIKTEPIIREKFGTFEDMLSTSFVSQFDLRSFVSEGKSERLDQILKFLGLNFFEKLLDIARKETKNIEEQIASKTSLYNDSDLVNLSKEKVELEQLISDFEELRLDKKNQILSLTFNKSECEKNIIDLSKLDLDIDLIELNSNKTELESQIKLLKNEIIDLNTSVEIDNLQIESLKMKLQQACKGHNLKYILSSQKEISGLEKEKTDIGYQVELSKNSKKGLEDKLDILTEQPWCATEDLCQKCKFLDDARDAKLRLPNVDGKLNEKVALLQEKIRRLSEIGFTSIEVKEVEKLSRQFVALTKNVSSSEEKKEKKSLLLKMKQNELEEVCEKLDSHSDIINHIKNNQSLQNKIKSIDDSILSLQSSLTSLENSIFETKSKISIIDGKTQYMSDISSQIKILEDKIRHYKLYSKIVHRTGIPFYIVRSVLPEINAEINKILSTSVNWSLEIEALADDKQKIPVSIYDMETDTKRPIESAGGAEQVLSSLAIRVALNKLCTLPKPNFLVLDEAFGNLDADNLAGVSRFLEKIKTLYDFVIVISHIEGMSDVCNYTLGISDNNGFSKIWKD